MNNTKLLTIHTRPEIRKGCVWEIQLKLSPDLVKSENIQQIYIEKPRAPNANKTEHHLCMKVRSKLIKPVRELAFSKVAAIVNEGETIECNENGVATLRVRFTARPRAVFHKHSDMMILIVAVRRGDVTVCSDQKELIFRGGTGSVHSADNRQQLVPVKTPKIKREPGDTTPDSPSGEDAWPVAMPEFEDFDSTKFCTDFMQNKGDSLLGFGGQSSSDSAYDFGDMDNLGSSGWPVEEDFGGSFHDVKFHHDHDIDHDHDHEHDHPAVVPCPVRIEGPSPLGDSSSGSISSALAPTPVSSSLSASSSSASAPTLAHTKFTQVLGKRRGSCTHCKTECSFYRGEGGPCNECGCFPARHVDIDKPTRTSKRKREAIADDDDDEEDDGRRKRLRYTLETKYFQKLFFNSLNYLSLPEISTVCAKAPVPVFVKDSNSVYIFVNPTFCNFILDLTRSDQVLNQSTSQVLGRHEAAEIVAQEQELMLGEEGKAREFDVSVKKQNFRVMKQWSTLRDGQRVIVGAVVSAY